MLNLGLVFHLSLSCISLTIMILNYNSLNFLVIIVLCCKSLMQIILWENSKIILFYKNYLVLVLLLILGNTKISLLINSLIEILVLFNLEYRSILDIKFIIVLVVQWYIFGRHFLLVDSWVNLRSWLGYSKWRLIILGRIRNYKWALISLIISSQLFIYCYKIWWDAALHVLIILIVNVCLLKNRRRGPLVEHILLSSVHVLHHVSIRRRRSKVRKRACLMAS